MFFSACWKKLPFINLEWVSYFYLFLFKVIVSGLLCHSAGSSARRWASGLAAGCILLGTVRTAPLIPLIGSLGLFFFFLHVDWVWRCFKSPFKLLNSDIFLTT